MDVDIVCEDLSRDARESLVSHERGKELVVSMSTEDGSNFVAAVFVNLYGTLRRAPELLCRTAQHLHSSSVHERGQRDEPTLVVGEELHFGERTTRMPRPDSRFHPRHQGKHVSNS